MQISFTGHHIELTPALKSFANEKFDKLQHYFEGITAIHVVFNVEKIRQMVEATAHVSKAEIYASAESDNMYTSIDLVVDKLHKQLVKHKEKLQEHRDK